MSEFLSMGGYAAFVWPSYGITALVLIANYWWIRSRHRRVLENLRRQEPVQDEAEIRPTVRHVP